MPRPRALYYDIMRYQPENLARLQDVFDLTQLTDPRDDTAAVLARTEVLFAPLGFSVDAGKMDCCPGLRAIVSNTTGIPHIDARSATDRNIVICALHDEPAFLDGITPTAEHTIGLMMAAWRKLPAAHAAAAGGKWDRRPWGAPRMLSRMRMGIVGYGRLGKRVARIAEAIGMETAYFDPYMGGGMDSLAALAARSDVLSLHAPANDETRNLVSRAVLEALPPGAIVVNTARGELLDPTALLDLLESGHLHAAALDTIDGEYQPGFSDSFADSQIATYVRNHDNLILTPHIGGSTYDAWRETEAFVIDKALRALHLDPHP